MTNEEFEKRKEFILGQQAQFAVGMQQLRETQAKTERVVAQMEKIVVRPPNKILEGSKDVRGKINALVDSQERTMEDLKKLIAALERYLSERRKGN